LSLPAQERRLVGACGAPVPGFFQRWRGRPTGAQASGASVHGPGHTTGDAKKKGLTTGVRPALLHTARASFSFLYFKKI